eukprot:TRINITY_DN48858_c0_g1_i1.p1 TRINITY_DN48858_c0_g1~~TRINITY_DN48858_c0_g1_i1.p1  ORF type:complete len:292 (-),score=47.92 TRINITY_DN48858_c0_g1_i1:21-896(-)
MDGFASNDRGNEANVDSDLAAAMTRRETGNALYKEQQFFEAAALYREALIHVRRGESASGSSSEQWQTTGTAVRLNLACCLAKLGTEFEEAVLVCDEVLASEPNNAKALFRRGAALYAGTQASIGTTSDQRGALSAARRDLLQARKLAPSERQIRTLLAEVTEALRDQDRQAAPPPTPPEPCATCGRFGHACCGKAWWVQQRAEWLRIDIAEAEREPERFEDQGSLAEVLAVARGRQGIIDHDLDEEVSDGEREMLEDCLEATDRPYPQPKKKLPLALAVQCAAELWADAS